MSDDEEKPVERAMQALVYACLRWMSKRQQAAVRDDLIQIADAADQSHQPKTAGLIRELAKAAESARLRTPDFH